MPASRANLFFFFSSRSRHTRCLSDWSSDVCSSDLPCVSAGGLRPQTECALCGTAARRVQRNVGIEQEWNVITAYVQIAVVNVGHVRQRVQILQLRTIGGVCDYAIFPVGNSQNVFKGFALGKFFDRIVEFLADDKINCWRLDQSPLRQYGHVWADEGNLNPRIYVLDTLGQPDVSGKTRRAGVKDEKFIFFGDVDRLFGGNVM